MIPPTTYIEYMYALHIYRINIQFILVSLFVYRDYYLYYLYLFII